MTFKRENIKFYITFLIGLIAACNMPAKKNNCRLTRSDIMENNATQIVVSDRFSDNSPSIVVDKKSDTLFGAYYFYPNGNLKAYKFFTSGKTYVYNEEFDSLGNLARVEGQPLLMHFFRKIDFSKVKFTFVFSNLNKVISDVQIKTNTGIKFSFDKPLRNINLSNTVSLSFELPVARTLNGLEIATSFQVEKDCEKNISIIKDTLRLENINF